MREYEYALAAVCPHDGALDTLVLPSVNAEAMSVFLAEVSERHAHEFIVMVRDGTGWHRARRLRIPSHMELIPLPAWSPQLNPVEHLWDEVREKRFANWVFASMDAVKEQRITALKTLEGEMARVASLTSFERIKSVLSNPH